MGMTAALVGVPSTVVLLDVSVDEVLDVRLEVVIEEEEVVLVTVPDVRVLEKKYIVVVSVVVVPVVVVAVEDTDVCVLLAEVLVVEMLDTLEDVLVSESVVRVEDVPVKLDVDEKVRLVAVLVDVVVEGHPFCSWSQHQSFFASDQLNSQLL
ncbi:hypothetical protein AK812_SmicGene13554 [Symbiodinium microadriaticum]|uniref:Uncharacterized protein n=1 Tax=Symbiodinium microadriaticum TaxID=2951 RepID=A0A1Q9E7T5_SYMMI|nr:hypothetical protein AK812_SmicGene13554 [Symbiodinium microadriaticum]